MSLKVYDGQGRWSSKTDAFRISPEEDEQLVTAVRLSTKILALMKSPGKCSNIVRPDICELSP